MTVCSEKVLNLINRENKKEALEDRRKKKNKERRQVKQRANLLRKLGIEATEKQRYLFELTAEKLETCGNLGVFRGFGDGVLAYAGQARCKNKFCTKCNKKLSTNRKNSLIDFLTNEADTFDVSEYVPYHLVFTLRHDFYTRNYDYTKELLEDFKKVRRKQVNNENFWSKYIEGGIRCVEFKASNSIIQDLETGESIVTANIHIHVIGFSKYDLEDTTFLSQLRDYWYKITGDSMNVACERVYTLVPNDLGGATKEYFQRGDGLQALEGALRESIKYVLKIDSKELGAILKMDRSTITSFLKSRHRVFSYFGELYGKGITKYKAPKEDDSFDSETEVIHPLTGEILEKSLTHLVITPFSNVREFMSYGEGNLYFMPINADYVKEVSVNELNKLLNGSIAPKIKQKAKEAQWAKEYGNDSFSNLRIKDYEAT